MSVADNAAHWVAWLTGGAAQFDIGYSQPRRWSFMDTARAGAGTADADCSALVAGAYNLGGIGEGFPEDGSTWTGSLVELAAERGFQIIPYDRIGGDPSNLLPGDMLLSERESGGVGHVAMVLWGDSLGEAWIDSQGSDGWDDPDEPVGDQTDVETRQISYTGHPYTVAGLWTHVLRLAGTQDAGADGAPAAQEISDTERIDDMILIETQTPWGDTAYALITEAAGAYALDAQQAQAYNAALGRCGHEPWDHYQLLVREAWQRRNDFVKALGGNVRESVDAATARVIAAVTGRTL